MSVHAAIRSGHVAVICGSSSGIGLALAKAYFGRGMNVVMADINEERLQKAAAELGGSATANARVVSHKVDVANVSSVQALLKHVKSEFPSEPLTVLHANAGVGGSTKATTTEGWDRIMSINFHGVVNVMTTFVPEMQRQLAAASDSSLRGLAVATGSKQGITTPPGSGAAYNISKAAVKVYTENLAHELRADDTSRIDVKLLVPGWVWTALTGAESGKSKPDGAFTPEQTVDYFFNKVQSGSFYIICPDNETTEKHDLARVEWSMSDLLQDRPALSRWHPKYAAEFEQFMKSKGL